MRIMVTVPWGERLGGAEALLQGVLGGGPGGEHELEPIFFQDGPWRRELADAGFRTHVVEAGRLREVHRWLATVARLARLFRARDPDAIVNWSAKTQLYGSPAAVLAGMSGRVVWWQHGIPIGNLLDKSATLLPAAAVGCCSHVAADAQARLRPRRRTFVVPPGSPPPADERPAALALPEGVPIVGLVGRLQVGKAQDQLLRAHAILHERGKPMHTLLVGGDAYGLSPEYAASLEPLARGLGIGQELTMTGQVPDAGPYIQRMDVLVNASDPEPFGIAILEGMARGVAVVATDSGGPPEFIEHGHTGVLARSGRPQDLAEALEPLLDSAQLRAEIGRAGRERFMRDFTTEALRQRFFANLREVVGARRG